MDRALPVCPVCGGIIEEGICILCKWEDKDSFYAAGRFDASGNLVVDSCERAACIGKDENGDTHFCPCLLYYSHRFNAVSVWCDPLKNYISIH